MFIILFSGSNETLATAIKIVIDGKDYSSVAKPIIKDNRTLVPLRFITEKLGGEIEWDGINRAVYANKGNKSINLVIDSKLIKFDDRDYIVIDTNPIIYNDFTYVPLRVIAEAFDIGIFYNERTKTVEIDTNKGTTRNKYYDISMNSLSNGEMIKGRTKIDYNIAEKYKSSASYIRLLLVDPDNHVAEVVNQINFVGSSLEYLPYIEHNGDNILVLAVYDVNNNLIAATANSVFVNVDPQISIVELEKNSQFTNKLSLTPETNFSLLKVEYTLYNERTNKETILENKDPYGNTTWYPSFNDRGSHTVIAKAFDLNSNVVSTKEYKINLEVEKKLELSGIKQNSIVNKPIVLNAVRNFDCLETQYILRDIKTKEEKILAKLPYGSLKYVPIPNDSGEKEFLVKVKDTSGKYIISNPIRVTVDGKPNLYLNGIGPNEIVLSEGKKIYVDSNVNVKDVKVVIANDEKNIKRILNSNSKELEFLPLTSDSGNWTVYATADYNGKTIKSETIKFKVYTGQTYGPYSISAKENYINFVSNLAKKSNNQLMSKSFKVAQSILETGWGQKVPSDKYTGVKSNNLFGIKSKNDEPYIISTTWEVYNGTKYIIDAKFRRYNSAQQSWDDHIKFLLDNDRYNPFEEVMYDPYKASWAIKRCGYATDPMYAIKIIELIQRYNLGYLDEKIF